MVMNKQTGFSLVEGLLVVFVICIVGVSGWYVLRQGGMTATNRKRTADSWTLRMLNLTMKNNPNISSNIR